MVVEEVLQGVHVHVDVIWWRRLWYWIFRAAGREVFLRGYAAACASKAAGIGLEYTSNIKVSSGLATLAAHETRPCAASDCDGHH